MAATEGSAEPGDALAGVAEAQRAAYGVAALAAVLYRYTGQHDIALAVQDAGSRRTLTLRCAGAMSFSKLLAQVDAGLREAPVDPGSNCQVAVQVGRAASPFTDIGADLHLVVDDKGGGLELLHDLARVPRATAQRLLAHLLTILRHATAADPRLAELDMLTPVDREFLARHGDGRTPPLCSGTVLAAIEAHARRHPDAVALRYRKQRITYRDLNRRANRLAHFLRARGIVAQSRIVVCVDPGIDGVVALLGVLKAGATYVPLSAAHPALRRKAVLDDTAPELVLTASVHSGLFADTAVELVLIDHQQGDFARMPVADPDIGVSGGMPASVFYTSGTTGVPKGVVTTHANLAHCVDAACRRFGFDAQDVFCAVAAFTFSISLHELLTPLCAGGTLLLLDRAHVLDPARMAITLQQVTVAHIGPSLLRNIVAWIEAQGIEAQAFAGLRHLSAGGDTVPAALLRRLQRLFSSSEIYVIYGCSEISLMGCAWKVPGRGRVARTLVGKPFPRVRLRVLDDDGNCLPPGAVGNVCFGGAGVTPGYLRAGGQQQKAWFRFDGERWYCTGDRGCIDERGNLELLGRRDFQIQLRGMRIELGEIEHHLRAAPGIRDAVVMPTRVAGDSETLVAWYVAAENACVRAEALRGFLLERLPDYMVPAFYQPLAALPLNHNLKVDRNALPAPALPARRNVTQPGTPSERWLAAIWRDTLKLDQVGLEDNFLLLGGDSLQAMQMILQVRQQLGVELDGMDVLRESLQVLARICDGRPPLAGAQPPATRTVPRHRSFFFGPQGSLYGVWHPPATTGNSRAVLICPPLGHEYSRTHFFLKTLAVRLAAAGYGVLRFDWYGTADSLGSSRDASVARWTADVQSASQDLRQRSGCAGIDVLGARLGANLALAAFAGRDDVRTLCWDPLVAGDEHLRRVTTMHTRRVRRLIYLRNFRPPRPARDVHELLGVELNRTCFEEIGALRYDPLLPRQSCVLTKDCAAAHAARADTLCVDVDCDWYDVARIGTAITSSALSDALLARLTEHEA